VEDQTLTQRCMSRLRGRRALIFMLSVPSCKRPKGGSAVVCVYVWGRSVYLRVCVCARARARARADKAVLMWQATALVQARSSSLSPALLTRERRSFRPPQDLKAFHGAFRVRLACHARARARERDKGRGQRA
jgi:hypothetical protein